MKFSLLALPALALAAVSPARQALQQKDLAIVQDANNQITPIETSFQSTLKSLNGAKATKKQIKQLTSQAKQINSILTSTKEQLVAAEQASGLSKRQESPGQQLEEALEALVTQVGMGIAAGIVAGSGLTDSLGDIIDQTLGVLGSLADPVSAASPSAAAEMTTTLDKILAGL